ncbi:MAG TPA: ornithine cyclodeaminase family protein, partial [Planctomycetaceae bacterium]|nr:ornithine cyclodeaminase family protein [Planctomycetaceae bacterium]
MPALYLTEDDVQWLLDLPTAIECVADAFRALARGEAENQPRRRVTAPGSMLHMMSASAGYLGYLGCKTYTTTRDAATFHVMLYDAVTGAPAAMIEANHLGQ